MYSFDHKFSYCGCLGLWKNFLVKILFWRNPKCDHDRLKKNGKNGQIGKKRGKNGERKVQIEKGNKSPNT